MLPFLLKVLCLLFLLSTLLLMIFFVPIFLMHLVLLAIALLLVTVRLLATIFGVLSAHIRIFNGVRKSKMSGFRSHWISDVRVKHMTRQPTGVVWNVAQVMRLLTRLMPTVTRHAIRNLTHYVTGSRTRMLSVFAETPH